MITVEVISHKLMALNKHGLRFSGLNWMCLQMNVVWIDPSFKWWGWK